MSLVSAITTLLIYSVEYNVLMINNSTSRILRYDQDQLTALVEYPPLVMIVPSITTLFYEDKHNKINQY